MAAIFAIKPRLFSQSAYANGNYRQMFDLDMASLSQHNQDLKIQ
jgi:hypothetical protein